MRTASLSLLRRKDKWHRARRLGGKLSMLHFFFQFEEQSSLSFIAPLFSRGKNRALEIDRSIGGGGHKRGQLD